jgi:hypothetical protein
MLNGIDGPLPTMKGFVMTTVKENPLVEVSVRSPKPAEAANNTSWRAGPTAWAALSPSPAMRACVGPSPGPAGRTTTSSGRNWSAGRCGPRATKESSPSPPTYKDGKVQVVITALDKDDEFLNFLDMSASVDRAGPENFRAAGEPDGARAVRGRVRRVADGNYFVNLTLPAIRIRTIRVPRCSWPA